MRLPYYCYQVPTVGIPYYSNNIIVCALLMFMHVLFDYERGNIC